MTAPLRIRGPMNARLQTSFDVPRLLPTLPDVLAAVSPLTLHTSPEQPSTLTLPTIPIRQQNRR